MKCVTTLGSPVARLIEPVTPGTWHIIGWVIYIFDSSGPVFFQGTMM